MTSPVTWIVVMLAPVADSNEPARLTDASAAGIWLGLVPVAPAKTSAVLRQRRPVVDGHETDVSDVTGPVILNRLAWLPARPAVRVVP